MTDDTRRPCNLCGREIVFVVNRRTGRMVPLDAEPIRVYLEDAERFGRRNDPAEPRMICRRAWRNHHDTCPKRPN